MLPETEAWVREYFESARRPGALPWHDIAEVAAHPTKDVAACTVTLREAPDEPERRRVALVDLGTHGHRLVGLPGECGGSTWSPDGSRLAVVADIEGQGAQAVLLDGDDLSLQVTSSVDGTVERIRWSPDGGKLALVVAETGAELSDVHGSGVIGPADADAWRPRVLPAVAGRRHLMVWSPAEGAATAVTDLNAWEADWLGPDRLVAIVSDGPGEDDWYSARLVVVDPRSGEHTAVLTPRHQLAQPRGSADGQRWSVLSGAASDRDLLAGSIVLGSSSDDAVELDTEGVHVTDHAWLADGRIRFAGLRGFETVVATVTPDSALEIQWEGAQTSGRYLPALACGESATPLIVLEEHAMPPSLGAIRGGSFEPIVSLDGEGSRHVVATAGRRERVTWAASDGTQVSGYLTVPPGDGPHALVVDVHGGPIHAVRSTWAGRDPYVSVLVARGYAVLQPNPRGSTGRGPAYAEAVIGDMGGADVDDILSGVQSLVDAGLADPDRLGITGVSYGGFMAAWIPCCTDIFKAGVSRSPCTDWRLMYLTSNIREFVRIFVDGDPDDPTSQYVTRSPLQYTDRVTTPLLFTSGSHDLACPPSQAHTMHTAMVERGVASELVVYPAEGHDVKDDRALVDQCARLIDWFERFMPPNRVTAPD